MTKQELYNKLEKNGLAKYYDFMEPHIKNAVLIDMHSASENNIPVGSSKIGGKPDLPKDYKLLTETSIERKRKGLFRKSEEKTVERPLSFIAQINLSDIKPYDTENLLPSSGILYFFYSSLISGLGDYSSDKDKFEVSYYDGDLCRLSRTDFPLDYKEETKYKPCQLSFKQGISLPNWDSDVYNFFDEEDKDFDSFLDISKATECTKLLGYADIIENAMEFQCELISKEISQESNETLEQEFEFKPAEWILLFQVDSNEESNMQWIDAGRLYYWIKKEDLLNKRFDKSWFCLQSF